MKGCSRVTQHDRNEAELTHHAWTPNRGHAPHRKIEYYRAWSKLNPMHRSSFKVSLMQCLMTIAQIRGVLIIPLIDDEGFRGRATETFETYEMIWKGSFVERCSDLVGDLHRVIDVLKVFKLFEFVDETHDLLGIAH